jgi:hypothetical protein
MPTLPVAVQIPVPGSIASPKVRPILELKVVQSVEESAPVVVELAVAMLMAGVVELLLTEMGPFPVTEVTVPASVMP